MSLKHKILQNSDNRYYKYKPQIIFKNLSYKLYYGCAMLTDKTIPFNRPDITLVVKTSKNPDIAVPYTNNIQKTITEDINKCAKLKDEVTRMLKQDKSYVVPIVISRIVVISFIV